ncbi:Phox homologous domain-containing protein [Jimgerdemannia flammicorona]|uniref:Sorting nexin-4 n=1 Tax=Jimgerdemannia flammicorona TaxID=994334 RepID=A0A433A134_9FUNG|nr:Phox homologous domain-containing protein [Jimgerdemannia flammicorona]
MNEDYNNVTWDIPAATDAITPYDLSNDVDPLSSIGDEMAKSFAEISTQRIDADAEEIAAIVSPSSSRDVHPFASNSTSFDTTSPTMPSFYARPHPEPTYEAPKPMTITVMDPQKEVDGSTYMSYQVTTRTTLETFSSANTTVRRRFQDFLWLYGILNLEFPQCVVPPMPEKHRMDYLTGDRFSPEFIEKRRLSLQRFLQRVARHPVLQVSENLRVFLESREFVRIRLIFITSDSPSHPSRPPPPSPSKRKRKETHTLTRASINDKAARAKRDQSVFDNIGDVLLNAFAKIRKPEEKFVEMREGVDKLEENFNMVARLYTRISKRQSDLQQDYTDFAASVQGLGNLETGVTRQLTQFSETTSNYVNAMKKMSDREDLEYLSEIHEYLTYCNAVKVSD